MIKMPKGNTLYIVQSFFEAETPKILKIKKRKYLPSKDFFE